MGIFSKVFILDFDNEIVKHSFDNGATWYTEDEIKEALESNTKDAKSCENCKHFQERSLKNYVGSCTLNKFMVPFEFSCNKHEPK